MHLADRHCARRVADRRPSLGSPDAPATLLYFGDFACASCRRFETGPEARALRSALAPSPLRLVFVPRPDGSEAAWRAAEAARFVWETAPSAYWAWHRRLFFEQADGDARWSVEALARFSRRFAGVDAGALERALAHRTYRRDVAEDVAVAQELGVERTPGFVLDGEVVAWPEVERAASAGRFIVP